MIACYIGLMTLIVAYANHSTHGTDQRLDHQCFRDTNVIGRRAGNEAANRGGACEKQEKDAHDAPPQMVRRIELEQGV